MCAHACSPCTHLLCVCLPVGRAPVPHVSSARLPAVCFESLCARVPLGSPETHLAHHPFPLRFLLLLCKQPVVLNCHLGSRPRIFAPGGVGRGSQATLSISFPGMETDLGPRAKAKSHPWPGKELALWPPLPCAELDRREGKRKSQIWKLGVRGQLECGPYPFGMARWRDQGLGRCLSTRFHPPNCRGLIVNQQRA